MHHGAQPVRDDERGAPAHCHVQGGLHGALALAVERAGGLVEQQQRRVLQDRPCDRDALALPAGEAHAALAQEAGIAFGQVANEAVRVRGARRRHDLVVARLRAAVADVLQRAGREDHAVLRHQADTLAQRGQVGLAHRHAVDGEQARLGVVKAQQQREQRGLAGAAGPDQRDRLARQHLEVHAVERRCVGPRRVVKQQVAQQQVRAAGRLVHRPGKHGCLDARAGCQQLHQPLAGAGRAQQVAPHFRQHRHRAHQQDHVDDGLAQVAGGDLAAQHRLRALVEPPQQRAEGGRDDEGHQPRAHARAPHGRGEGGLGGAVEALRLAQFLAVALHHRHGVQHFSRDRARVGHAVLAGARKLSHLATEAHRRQHHQHQDAQYLRHHHRVGDDQHHHRADAHHGVAQAHAQARADDGLHQGRVGGQARQHLAGLRGLEELRALLHHMRVDRIAQVGRDPLAEPGDHVEAQRREHPERGADAEQREEMAAQREDAFARVGGNKALVDQRLERDRHRQRGERRHHQEQGGQGDAAVVRRKKRQQVAQRAHRAGSGRRGRSGGGGAGCGQAACRGRGRGSGDGNGHRESVGRRSGGAPGQRRACRRRASGRSSSRCSARDQGS